MNRRIYVKKIQNMDCDLALRYFIPDVRDGLTLLERMLIYAMHEMNILPEAPNRKSITVISQAMSYVDKNEEKDLDLFYDALLWLVKGSDCKYPLVDGVGRFTEIDYDCEVIRRTFVKMTPYAIEMLKGLEKDAADFEMDEDGEKLCPKVLPGCFPYLLVHGTWGHVNDNIKTISQPLNISEVIDAIIKVIDEPEITIEELSKIIEDPDALYGGRFVRDEYLSEAYTTGQGYATSLQAYWPINMYVLVDGKPEILNLREIIDQYLKHQKEVVTRKLQYDMKDDNLQVDECELLQIIKLELLDLKDRFVTREKRR